MVMLTDHHDMSIAVDWDIKSQTKQTKVNKATSSLFLIALEWTAVATGDIYCSRVCCCS